MQDMLQLIGTPKVKSPRMVLGFSGWMDGGEVSTGTVVYLVNQLRAVRFAEILPSDFYIYNFPGPMELSAVFRPYVRMDEGLIKDYQEPSNTFYYEPENDLILFIGKEPNIHWGEYVSILFQVAEQYQVREMYFIGSVAGLVPHTREPKFSSFVNQESLKAKLAGYHVTFSNYEGPASIVTHISDYSSKRQIPMIGLVAEIPAYVQGRNPKCIEATARRLAKLLEIEVDFEYLRIISEDLEKKLDKAVQKRAELAEHIKRLEENYDKEVFDTEMDDLKSWLVQQGIRVD